MFDYNYGGLDGKKIRIHAKGWDFYMNKKGDLIKGGYLVEFFGHDRKKVIWKVVGDHVVEE